MSTVFFVRTAANYAVVAISFDRLVAVYVPFKYRGNTSKKISLLCISMCWILSLIMGYTTLFFQTNETQYCSMYKNIDQTKVVVFGVFARILPCVIVLINNFLVFYGVRRVSNKKCKFNNIKTVFFKISKRIKMHSDVRTLTAKAKIERDAQKREVKSTLRIFLIVGTFLICELVRN